MPLCRLDSIHSQTRRNCHGASVPFGRTPCDGAAIKWRDVGEERECDSVFEERVLFFAEGFDSAHHGQCQVVNDRVLVPDWRRQITDSAHALFVSEVVDRRACEVKARERVGLVNLSGRTGAQVENDYAPRSNVWQRSMAPFHPSVGAAHCRVVHVYRERVLDRRRQRAARHRRLAHDVREDDRMASGRTGHHTRRSRPMKASADGVGIDLTHC